MANYTSNYTGEQIDAAIAAVANKVDKIEGKGLSENDYTTTDKEKLAGLNESHLEGLRVLCVGDSITAGQGMTTATRWANVMATQHNWNLTVQAQGGISMSNYYYREHGISEIGCVSKIDYIATMNPKPDLVIVWAGHNDTSYRHSPLGSFDDIQTQDTTGVLPTYADRYSFKGAIRYISEVVHNYAPEATLVICTREWLSLTPSVLQVPEGTTDTNLEFDKAIMENGYRYGYIPLNMSLCGITPWTLGNTTSDRVHPNAAGTRLIVKYLSSELNKIYYIYGIQTIPVTGITLNKASTSILVGATEQLSATITPQDATNKNVNWHSSNTAVATVDSSGIVTAVSVGSANITATTVDGNFNATCSVAIQAQNVPVTGVSLSPSTVTLLIGESTNLTATITPANATNQNLIWTSSDDQTIDVLQQNGHITALNVGSGTVTVRTEDGNFTDTCDVTINPLQNYYILESLNSLTHDQWQDSSFLNTQYFAFDGTNSKEQLTGKTIQKVWIKTASGFTASDGIVYLYDVPLTGTGGSAAAPSDWTLIEQKEFTNITASMPLEFVLTNSHVVQSNHTIGIHTSRGKMIGTFNNTQVSVKLDSHYFADAAATTSTAISLNAVDFFVSQ